MGHGNIGSPGEVAKGARREINGCDDVCAACVAMMN